MKKKSPNTLLNESIEQMKIKRAYELNILKAQVHEVHESFKPVNLIKDTFISMTASKDLKTGIGKTVIGIVSGLLFKKMFFGKTQNPIKKTLGILLQTTVVGLVASNSDKIISTGGKLLHSVFSKFKHK